MSDPIPTLRAYGRYLESLERPLDVDALVAEGSARRAEAIVADLTSSRDERTGHRRWLIPAAAVVATALVVGGTVLLAGSGRHTRTVVPAGQTPSTTPPPTAPTPPESGPYRRLDGTFSLTPPVTVPGDGSASGPLVPEGEPSSAETGELVAAINLRHRNPLVYRLYADGRLLQGCITSCPPSGWVEQRLTPEGVERVRSRFLSSGLFDSTQPLSDAFSACGIVRACVRDGDHWLGAQVDVGGATESRATPDAVRLFDDLKMLDSTLPATEWADQQIKPYVPARIAVCLQVFVAKKGTAVQVPTDLSILLPRFPARAAELLDGRDAMGRIPSIEDFGGSCFEMTLDEARTLADEFLAPSGGGSHEYWGIVVKIKYQFDASRPPATGSPQYATPRKGTFAHTSFKQLLPDTVDATLGD